MQLEPAGTFTHIVYNIQAHKQQSTAPSTLHPWWCGTCVHNVLLNAPDLHTKGAAPRPTPCCAQTHALFPQLMRCCSGARSPHHYKVDTHCTDAQKVRNLL